MSHSKTTRRLKHCNLNQPESRELPAPISQHRVEAAPSVGGQGETPSAVCDQAILRDLLAEADAAAAGGEADRALTILTELRRRFPRDGEPFFRIARLLQDHDRPVESDQVLVEGQQSFPTNFGFIAQRAWGAHRRRDLVAAAERWAEMRDSFPDNPGGYHGGAISLREAGRIDEAEVLFASAMQRFPNDFGIAGEHARAAAARRDFARAAARWEKIIARFPGQPSAYIGAAQAFREMGQFEAADAKLRAAAEHFPGDAHIALEFAWVAQIAHDWPKAAVRWGDVRARFPQYEVAYLMGAGALRALGRMEETDSVLAAWIERFPKESRPMIEHARFAAERGNGAEAVQRWERVRIAFPNLPDGHFGTAEALSQLRREEEADELLAIALRRFPVDGRTLQDHAWAAYRRQSWQTAAQRFSLMRERFPDEPVGYHGGAAVLAQQGRVPEAEALLEKGLTRLPANPQLALEHARLAVHLLGPRRDWDQALRRLENLRGRFPDFEPAYFFAVNFARQAALWDEAEAMAHEACSRFPANLQLAAEQARISLEREDWEAAVGRFTRVTETFPNEPAGYVGLAQALSRSGRFDDADSVLRYAMARFPADAAAFSEYGLVAIRMNDWKAALDRALAAQARFPNEAGMAQQVFEARLRLAETDPGAASTVEDIAARSPTEIDQRELMMRFESLGGSGHGCEFGIVQRKFSAEPLGLLRWADLGRDCETLISALDSEFVGVGEPDQTELITLPTGKRMEYWTRDRRYFMAMRAFIFEDEIPYDKMYAQACRRLQYLRRKLIEDLRDGSKIFVYKNMWRDLTDDELTRLHAAVRRYGDNTLLYVQFADADHPNGTVEPATPGLLIGYIDHFAFSPEDKPQGEATLSWLGLCRAAVRVTTVRASGRTPEAAPALA